MRPKIVAIHQPNFLPWLGFFDKIARSDVFVLLDNVQFSKKGGTWTNRVRILINGQPNWLTVPVERNFHGTRLINETVINNRTNWRETMLRSIKQYYSRTPYFKEIMPSIESIINYQTSNLAEFNMKGIRILSEIIGLSNDHLVPASSLGIQDRSNELLIAITKKLGGDTYMCGGGAEDYQDEQKFIAAGLSLSHQNFRHPQYKQISTTEFAPGLSIIDALFNIGTQSVKDLFRNANETPTN